jgi:Glycosyl hydrolase catalytic core
MRFARVSTLAVASAVACGSSNLLPIREPALDAALAPSGDAGPGEVRTPMPDAGAPPARTCKRGIAANAAPSAAFAPAATVPGVSWWYNWANQPPAGGDPRIDFVPMIWGGGSLGQTIPASSKALLGFNEPNFVSQADLTAQKAASDWPAIEAKAALSGIPIASPGVNFCGSPADAGGDPSGCTEPAVTDPYSYLREFFADCQGCKVDYVAVHWYGCDLASLRDYIDGDLDSGGTFAGFVQFGRPIWVTEFSCDAKASVAAQKAYMQAAVPYLEGHPGVARYAWFSAKNIPNGQLANSDGSRTDLGQTYVDLAQSCP